MVDLTVAMFGRPLQLLTQRCGYHRGRRVSADFLMQADKHLLKVLRPWCALLLSDLQPEAAQRARQPCADRFHGGHGAAWIRRPHLFEG